MAAQPAAVIVPRSSNFVMAANRPCVPPYLLVASAARCVCNSAPPAVLPVLATCMTSCASYHTTITHRILWVPARVVSQLRVCPLQGLLLGKPLRPRHRLVLRQRQPDLRDLVCNGHDGRQIVRLGCRLREVSQSVTRCRRRQHLFVQQIGVHLWRQSFKAVNCLSAPLYGS